MLIFYLQQEVITSKLIIVSATRRRDIKIPFSVNPRAEKFNIVSNDHGHTHRCNFFIFDRKYPFWVNLVKQNKTKKQKTKKKSKLSV